MFDFSQIAQVGESLSTAARDIDSRLESIDNKLSMLIMLLAMEQIAGNEQPEDVIRRAYERSGIGPKHQAPDESA